MEHIVQMPAEGCWLYRNEDGERVFSSKVIRPIGSEPWGECTDAEKIAWEESHREEVDNG